MSLPLDQDLASERSGGAAGAGIAPVGERAVQRVFRIELASGLLTAGTLTVLEMGPALAKKAYAASDFEVALLSSGQSLGLIFSFFTAHLAAHRRRVPIVFALQLVANLALLPVVLISPSFALGFVVLHALARIAWSMSGPAQVLVYRGNFPVGLRGRVVGRLRQLQLYVTTVFALLLSIVLDWSGGAEQLVRWLGTWPFGSEMVRHVVPALALVGLAGSCIYRLVPELGSDLGEAPVGHREAAGARRTAFATLKEFWRVWRADRAFRRYQSFFFLFGFANIMTIPLTQIHAVDVLEATYFDLAMVNVVLVQAVMGLSMVWWGRCFDRHSPIVLRGVLNLIFSVDFLCLGASPAMGWVYFGRVFRGIALGGGTLVWMLGPLWFARRDSDAAVYTGIHSVLTGVRWAFAPFVGVLLKDLCGSNARPVFLVAFVVLVATGAALLVESRGGHGGGAGAQDPPRRQGP